MEPAVKLWMLHPIAVHFPIALLSAGFVALIISFRWPREEWLGHAVTWLLWLGTAAAWTTLGLGLLAETTAPHVPPAWEALADHKSLAWKVVGIFTGISFWRWSQGRKREWILILAWLVGLGALVATGYFGGRVVFFYGMGVEGHGLAQ